MAIYACVQCDEECLDGSIQCVPCEMWVHSACVPMLEELLSEWSDANITVSPVTFEDMAL